MIIRDRISHVVENVDLNLRKRYRKLNGKNVKMGIRPIDTPIKKKIKFSSYFKEIQIGTVAKPNVRKGFLIYEEMRKYFPNPHI